MASRYEVLATMVDNSGSQYGDSNGDYHLLVGILEILHHAPESEVSDRIYDLIADGYASIDFDKPAEFPQH